ncbi:MAG TPA: PepSY domain-containing protein [Rhizobiaceae bacterium]
MFRNTIIGSVSALLLLCGAAQAQTNPASVPPANAMKLSEIVAKIEQRDGFRFISDIEWDRDGTYDITYYTSDNAKVEIKIDAATGQPKPWGQ